MAVQFWPVEEKKVEKNSPFLTNANSNSNPRRSLFFPDNEFGKALTQKTFKKEECLKSRHLIDLLFKKGNRITSHPIRLVALRSDLDTSYPAQVGFAVPKRFFPKAVTRNRIKRLMRESYRLNKEIIYRNLLKKGSQYAIMLIYTSKSEASYEEIESKIILTLTRFNTTDETS
jgi:ribonuclease P protein component